MDIRKVKKLIELLDESGIAEIEISEGEDSVRISASADQLDQAEADLHLRNQLGRAGHGDRAPGRRRRPMIRISVCAEC